MFKARHGNDNFEKCLSFFHINCTPAGTITFVITVSKRYLKLLYDKQLDKTNILKYLAQRLKPYIVAIDSQFSFTGLPLYLYTLS